MIDFSTLHMSTNVQHYTKLTKYSGYMQPNSQYDNIYQFYWNTLKLEPRNNKR